MKKRPWLVWLLVVLAFIAGGILLWIKLVADKQPLEHPDPGIPNVQVPDPPEEEEEEEETEQ